MKPSDDFPQIQSFYFEAPEEERYRHQTAHPFFAQSEKALLEGFEPCPGECLLEIGCGEGGNLFFLQDIPAKFFGIDLFVRKLVFAKGQLQNCGFICSGAEYLPFSDESFDVVLCRDVLHHLPDRGRALKEMTRVCRQGGRMVIIEPNGRNLIMRVLPWLVKAESEIKKNSPQFLAQLLNEQTGLPVQVTFRQPFPLFRMLLHYRYGFPWLGRCRWVTTLFGGIDRVAGKILPPSRWAYMIFEIRKP
jgi:SAM-dependent methyltransferase